MKFPADRPIIYLITPGEATPVNFKQKKQEILSTIESAASDGVTMIQLREKQLPARLAFELASDAVSITRRYEIGILVNERTDIALAAGADGVHLTSRSVSASTIRDIVRPGFIIGRSVHTLAEAAAARDEKADFVTLSPIFDTPGKGSPLGLSALTNVCGQLSNFPIIALGGINLNNIDGILSGGAAGLAAIRFLNDDDERKRALGRLR